MERIRTPLSLSRWPVLALSRCLARMLAQSLTLMRALETLGIIPQGEKGVYHVISPPGMPCQNHRISPLRINVLVLQVLGTTVESMQLSVARHPLCLLLPTRPSTTLRSHQGMSLLLRQPLVILLRQAYGQNHPWSTPRLELKARTKMANPVDPQWIVQTL